MIKYAMVIILLVSVTTIAVLNGNPFHVITFAITTILILIFSIWGYKKTNVETSVSHNEHIILLLKIFSAILLFIGIFYPEFTDVSMPKFLLYAPVGIVPCPTLLTTLGFMNLNAKNKDRAPLIVLAVMSSIYGIIGFFCISGLS